MQASDFVVQLAETAPKTRDLLKLGLSLEGAKSLIGCSVVVPRTTLLSIDFTPADAPSTLVELVSLYDVSKLEIGVISFLEAPADYGSYLQVAKVELDPVVIYPDGEISVIDW